MEDRWRVRASGRDAVHVSRKVGQDEASPRPEPGHGQPRLARASGNVEMLMITGDAQTPCNFFFQAEDGIRDRNVTGVQTCALPISRFFRAQWRASRASDRSRQRQAET